MDVISMKTYTPLILLLFFSLPLFSQQGQSKLFKTPFPVYDSTSNNKYFRQSKKWSIEEYLNFFSTQREYIKYREKDDKVKVQTFRFEGDPVPYLTQEIQQLILTSKKYTGGTDNISKLHNRLDKLYGTIKTNAGQMELSALYSEIFQLPPTLNKINLLVRLANFKIFNKTYLSGIRFFENKISEVITLLPSDFMKAQGYIQLGNFYNNYYISDMAVEMYYKARQFIYKSRLSQKQKNDYQAKICILLSAAFSKDYYAPHISKSNYYYNQAVQYFMSNKDTINATLSSLRSVANSVFTLDELTKTLSQQEYNHYVKSLFFYLQNWLLFHDESENVNTGAAYAGTYSIGALLWKFGKPGSAVNYFIETLVYAIRNKEYSQIKSALSYLSFIYSKTGEAVLSRKYSDLLALFKESPDKYVLITDAFNKAEQLDNLKAHDSAYAVMEALEADTALVNYFYPPVQDGIYEKIYKNKAVFLFPIDSFQSYKALNTYYTYRELRKDQFATMLAAESKGISTWLEDVADKELMLKAELIRVKDENNQILSGKNRLLDILSRLTKDSLVLANENRQKDSIYYTDTLAKANTIRALEKKNADTEISRLDSEKKLARLRYGLLLAALLLSGFLIIALMKRKQKRQKEETERINTLVKNNIHNYQNDYSAFRKLIRKKDEEGIIKYERHYGQYLSLSFANWKKEQLISLSDELDAGRSYFNAKQTIYPDLTLIEAIKIGDTTRVKFLQSVFDTLISNSVKHGFKTKAPGQEIRIEIFTEKGYLKCVFVDNGIPPVQEISYLERKDSGLDLLRSRIRNTFVIARKSAPPDFFSAEALPNGAGTKISFKLLYEEI